MIPTLDGHDTHHGKTWVNDELACAYEVISIKATEGTTFVDPTFERRWQVLRTHAVRYRCAYWWARPNKPIEPQFQLFKAQIDKAGGLGIGEFTMLDAERTDLVNVPDGSPPEYLSRAQVEEALALVEAEWPGRNTIYCSAASFPEFIRWRAANPTFPLWFPRWPNLNSPASLAASWDAISRNGAVLWQWSDNVTVPGIGEHIDGDMIVDRRALDQLTAQTETPKPQEDQVKIIIKDDGDPAQFAVAGLDAVWLQNEADAAAVAAANGIAPTPATVPAAALAGLVLHGEIPHYADQWTGPRTTAADFAAVTS